MIRLYKWHHHHHHHVPCCALCLVQRCSAVAGVSCPCSWAQREAWDLNFVFIFELPQSCESPMQFLYDLHFQLKVLGTGRLRLTACSIALVVLRWGFTSRSQEELNEHQPPRYSQLCLLLDLSEEYTRSYSVLL